MVSSFEPAKGFVPLSTLIPGMAPCLEISSGIVDPNVDFCLIVSSNKITPPI